MSQLSEKTCVPCRGGVPALTADQIRPLKEQLTDWKVIENHHLSVEYFFTDFANALAYVNKVGAMAEEQGHHPDIALGWGKVGLTVWTHKIDGLTESDFIFAAKASDLAKNATGRQV